MCNAVRDNPERVQFVGYDPQVVRYLAFCLSGFFAGIAGRACGDQLRDRQLRRYLGAAQSGTVLFATYHRRHRLLLRPDRRRDLRHCCS